MRLIGHVENEKQAFTFYSFLLEQGIHSTYEKQFIEEEKKEGVLIWIYEEDQVEKALFFLDEFKKNPKDPKFAKIEFPTAPPQPPDLIAEQKEQERKSQERNLRERIQNRSPFGTRKKRSYPLTYFIIFLCLFLFFWNSTSMFQMIRANGPLTIMYGFTPLQRALMYDYPKSTQKVDEILKEDNLKTYQTLEELPKEQLDQFIQAENIPTWRGILPLFMNWVKKKPENASLKGSMFVKIREGEVWRFFTPCLLHAGILHILFNMLWAWVLLKQVEVCLPKWKILLLIILIGVISNTSQYLMSGANFLGFSGVVCGLVGFIWVRQKIAPWEGYPLQKITIIFVLVYVIAMFVLEIFSLFKTALSTEPLTVRIANTAHIIGGVSGAVFGFLPWFSRGIK